MPEWFFYLFVFVLGLIVGSFLNVVIYRYNTGLGIMGRSFCFACRRLLIWSDLIPLASFIYRRAKCRTCGSRISWQYPLVELATGLIFVLLAWQFNPWLSYDAVATTSALLFYWVIASILLIITVYDLKHKIIPDDFVIAFIGLSFFGPFITRLSLGAESFARLGSGLLAAGVLFLFFWGLWRYSEGRWMGFGDVKLVIGIGLLLGFYQGLTAVIIAFWLGAVVGLLLILFRRLHLWGRLTRGITIKSELPFAPFLVLATLLGLIFNFNIFSGWWI